VTRGRLAGGAEEAVLVEADDGVDAGARRLLVPEESPFDIGAGEAVAGQQLAALGLSGR
jgi:hypothetical protein